MEYAACSCGVPNVCVEALPHAHDRAAVGGSTAAKAAAAVAQKSEASAVYKSMFMTKEDREREAEKDAKNYAARGIPMNLNWL